MASCIADPILLDRCFQVDFLYSHVSLLLHSQRFVYCFIHDSMVFVSKYNNFYSGKVIGRHRLHLKMLVCYFEFQSLLLCISCLLYTSSIPCRRQSQILCKQTRSQVSAISQTDFPSGSLLS